MSLLLAHGHADARRYTVGQILDESRLVIERLNAQMATEAVLTQIAVSSLLSQEGGKAFKEHLERLTDG